MDKYEEEEIRLLLEKTNNELLMMQYSHVKPRQLRNLRVWINKKGFYVYRFKGIGLLKIGLGGFEFQISRSIYKKQPKSVMEFIKEGKKVQAIKAYRAWANCRHVGLKESKEAVELLMERYKQDTI